MDVFLGGSCNPTTWRTEIAIPILERLGLSYYNPVNDWRPELLKLENEAKKRAGVLFFVLDNQTRSTAAMIEVAHALGKGQQLVLVINKYSWPGAKIAGEEITFSEYEDLTNCQTYLRDLATSNGVQVYDGIDEALVATADWLRGSSNSSTMIQTKRPLVLQRSTSLNSSSSSIMQSQSCIQQMQTRSNQSMQQVQFIKKNVRISSSGDTTDCSHHRGDELIRMNSNDCSHCGDELIRMNSNECRLRNIKNRGRRPLFLVTSAKRCLVEMILASYFLGRGEDVVVCIQELPSGAIVDGEKLSELAIKDYNRGRAYLSDLARSSGVTVFKHDKEAFNQYRRTTPSSSSVDSPMHDLISTA